jgi:hypothetical protein
MSMPATSLVSSSALRHWLAAGALALPLAAAAQSFCASDGQPAPSTIAERFISADCEACWGNAGKKLARGALALDWIVPGSLGEDAPLSAAAQRDGLARLEALHRQAPGGTATALVQTRVHRGITGRLRVAHGLPLADYIGASIELKPVPRAAGPRPWTAWLLLVETIAAGSEGTPIERNLVRNALVQEWTALAGRAGRRAARQGPASAAAFRIAADGHTRRRQARAAARGGLGAGRAGPGVRRGTVALRAGRIKPP